MSRRFKRFFVAGLVSVFALTSCSSTRPRETARGLPVTDIDLETLSEDEREELMAEVGENWLYGPGLGTTALNVMTVVAFPPYALYLAGNTLLELSGNEPLRFSDALPDEGKREWQRIYGGIVSGPGRAAAAVAGKEYRTPERAQEQLQRFIPNNPSRNLELYLVEG